MNKKVRLIDVATRAGVSKSTASQFLNGRYDFMSEETRLRLKKAVKELNYVPNNIARSLTTNKTNIIGVIVRDITSYYTSQSIRGMDDYCKQLGYNLFIYNTDFDSKIEKNALNTLCQQNVDGIIIASCGSNGALIEDIARKTAPVVQFQLEHENCETSIIVADYKKSSFEATEYLIGLGHSRIAFVTQKLDSVNTRREKYQGFIDAHVKHGLTFDEDLILYWNRESGLQNSLSQLLKSASAPTAFFTQQSDITIDVLREFNQLGVNIPNDLSLLGFEEISNAEFFKVPITVIKQQPYEMGREAIRLLLDKVSNPKSFDTRVTIPCSLVKRNSCQPPPVPDT